MTISRFKPFAGTLLAAFAMLGCLAPAAAAGPDIQQWTTPAGVRVSFVESHALPMIDIQVDFAAGSARDPEGKAGLASLTRSLLDAGTATLNEQQIADRAADIGAMLGGGTDDDRANVSIRTLSSTEERDAAVALLAELLAAPAFPEDILARERARSIAALRESLTRPATLAGRAFIAGIYGDHPYGRLVTVESLEAIGRADLVAFHREHYVTRRATVAIVGDLDRSAAEAVAVRLTERLPQGEPAAPLTPPAQPARHTLQIPHPSAQAHILVGMPGISRDDPDYFPLVVGNYTLGGGGFVSRLTKEVREERGFAYSINSSFSPAAVAGPFEIGLQTRGSQSEEALAVVDRVLADFVRKGPSADELEAARDFYINGFGLRLDSNRKILGYVAMIGFYGLPLDWLDRYPREVAAVTADAVRDAFARRVRPEHLVTVVAGGTGDDSARTARGKEGGN